MSESHWYIRDGELEAWKTADCKHEKVKMFQDSVRSTHTCEDCGMMVTAVKVFGRVEGS